MSDTESQGDVLIATEDQAQAGAVRRFLEGEGFSVEARAGAKALLRAVGERGYDVILLDLALAEETDVELVSFIRRRRPGAQLILLFGPAQVERAVAGIRQGAFFYLPRHSQPSDISLIVRKASQELDRRERLESIEWGAFQELLGDSPRMRRVIEIMRKVAPTDSTVLLLGESGTGKEVIANAIHRLSDRRDRPFVAVNCAALPENLLESELFGHVKGAFTGAENDKTGLFEQADGGALFLDEIGDMAPMTQAKLLRVLQNGEVRRVGSVESHRVDVRVIAATNRNLEELVREGDFREDLYFRLNVIAIRIPPLRERDDVLPKLVSHFVRRFAHKYGREIHDIDEQAQSMLRNYDYPGNVRELESIIQHAVIMNDGGVIRAQDLPDELHATTRPQRALPYYAGDAIPTIEQMEEQLIRNALERLGGNQTEAAKRLGISRSTLWRKMKSYGIEAPE